MAAGSPAEMSAAATDLNELLRELEQEARLLQPKHQKHLQEFASSMRDPLPWLLDRAEAVACSEQDRPLGKKAVYLLFQWEAIRVREDSFKAANGRTPDAVNKASLVLIALLHKIGAYKQAAARVYAENADKYIDAMRHNKPFQDYVPEVERNIARANHFAREERIAFPMPPLAYFAGILGNLSLLSGELRRLSGNEPWNIDPAQPHQAIMQRLDASEIYWSRLDADGRRTVDASIAKTLGAAATYPAVRAELISETAKQLLALARRMASYMISPRPHLQALEQHCQKYMACIPPAVQIAMHAILESYHQKV